MIFFSETLRLQSGPSLFRFCTKDYTIPHTDIVIEKGCIVSIPNGCLQKDPQYFSEPEKFNPDRFEEMNAIPKGVYFPFGSGPRICVGNITYVKNFIFYTLRCLLMSKVCL